MVAQNPAAPGISTDSPMLLVPEGLSLRDITLLPDVNGLSLLDAACALAEMGFPVFPCEPNGKRPHPALRRPTRRAPSGLYKASTEPAAAESWWTAFPDANIGIRTGVVCDALDIDVKNASPGWESVRQLDARYLLGGAFAQQATPSGGGHLLFAPSGDGNHSAGKAAHGLDFRGKGGYILAGPSTIQGASYVWLSVKPERYGAALSWDALTEELAPVTSIATRRRGQPRRSGGPARVVAEASPGNRNNALYWSASRYVEDGRDPIDLLPFAVSVGLSEREATATIRSATKRAAR